MENAALSRKTAQLYAGLGWRSLFARIRLWDAPYEEAERMIPKKGKIVELGCGEGIFSNYIALGSANRQVIGIDIDKKRIFHARRGVPNASFVLEDASKAKIPKANAIVLMHLLHHLSSFKMQDDLLRACYSKLHKRGKLIIVEIEPKFSMKYFVTYLTDHFLVPWIFEKRLHSKIYFRKKSEWAAVLKSMGFKVNCAPADRGKPFSHVIFECIRA